MTARKSEGERGPKSELAQPAGGEGEWVMVPREPTEAMYMKGGEAILSSGLPVANLGVTLANAAIRIYSAMLAAAPAAPPAIEAQWREAPPWPDLRHIVRHCAQTFRAYEALHAAKDTPEGVDKALTNAAHAEMCERALRPPEPIG